MVKAKIKVAAKTDAKEYYAALINITAGIIACGRLKHKASTGKKQRFKILIQIHIQSNFTIQSVMWSL